MRTKLIFTLILVFSVALPVLAQPPMPELDGDIVMQGLNGPQGLHVDADGNLWVIESGLGGDETVAFFNATTLAPTDGSFGLTSRVIRLSTTGDMQEVAALPSIAAAEDAIGGARITGLDGVVYATVGGWHANIGDTVTVDNYAAIVSVSDGAIETIADMWAHELTHNPDGIDNIESHPYGITAGDDGMLYVADAAANALIVVDPATGDTTTLAHFDAMPGVFPNPARGGELLTDPVPTAVAFNDNGEIFVSLLSGAPFIPGSAKVVQVAPDGTVTDFATGFTMLTDLQAGPDGNLYAVSFGMFTEEGPVFNSGSVLRILPDGTSEIIIEGLPFATGLALDADGNGYVAINGVPIPNAGMVVYYAGLTGMEGTPIPASEMGS